MTSSSASLSRVTDDFYVAPQLRPADLAGLKAVGVATIFNNRPDGEAADQPSSEDMRAAAEAAGLGYVYLPVSNKGLALEDVKAFARHYAEAEKPVLGYCRSGKRSIMLWAFFQAGRMSPEEIVAAAARAGHDISKLAPYLGAPVAASPA